jgi:hypothetical protein
MFCMRACVRACVCKKCWLNRTEGAERERERAVVSCWPPLDGT